MVETLRGLGVGATNPADSSLSSSILREGLRAESIGISVEGRATKVDWLERSGRALEVLSGLGTGLLKVVESCLRSTIRRDPLLVTNGGKSLDERGAKVSGLRVSGRVLVVFRGLGVGALRVFEPNLKSTVFCEPLRNHGISLDLRPSEVSWLGSSGRMLIALSGLGVGVVKGLDSSLKSTTFREDFRAANQGISLDTRAAKGSWLGVSSGVSGGLEVLGVLGALVILEALEASELVSLSSRGF